MRQDGKAFYPRRNPDTGVREDRWRFLETASISLGLPSLFYASLRHPRVFEGVIGRSMDAAEWEVVTLDGYRLAEAAAGTGYPGIFPAESTPHHQLDCLLVHDLDRFEQAMVAWYEWDEYVLQRVSLTDGRAAQVFLPDLDAIRREYGEFEIVPWSFETWRTNNLEQAVDNARAWMEQRPGDDELLDAGCVVEKDLPSVRRAAG